VLTIDRTLDARGLMCPMPTVKAGAELKRMATGQVLKVIISDPAARSDFPAWAEDFGHELLETAEEADGALAFVVRKGEE
jgi:tRNA 2-thiouridine synthesizing protein A